MVWEPVYSLQIQCPGAIKLTRIQPLLTRAEQALCRIVQSLVTFEERILTPVLTVLAETIFERFTGSGYGIRRATFDRLVCCPWRIQLDKSIILHPFGAQSRHSSSLVSLH
jgi:hypothetical protein